MNRAVNFLLLVLLPVAMYSQGTHEQRSYSYAEKLFNDGLYEIALEQYRQYLQEFPRGAMRPDAALNIGITLVRLNRFSEARSAFLQVDLDYPGSEQARRALWLVGESYEIEKNREQAARAFQRVALYYPDWDEAPWAFLRGARNAEKAGNSALQTTLLNAVVETYFQSTAAIRAWIQLAHVYQAKKEYQLAWNVLDRAYYASPPDSLKAAILLRRASLAEQIYGYRRAAELYSRFLDEYHRTKFADQARIAFGELELRNRRYGEARDLLERAARSDVPGEERRAHVLLGDLAYYQGDIPAAREAYRAGLNVQGGTNPQLRMKYALMLEESEEANRAFEWYSEIATNQKGLDGDTSLYLLFEHLGTTAIRVGRYREAASALEQLLSLQLSQGNQPSIYHRLGDLYGQHLGEYEEAERYYMLIVDSFPGYPDIDKVLYALGRSKLSAGQPKESRQIFKKLTERYPFTQWYADAKEYIWYIDSFHGGTSDLGFQHLASLFGELLLKNNPADLYFKLGKIYYRDQQNYAAATEQFQALLKQDIEPSLADSVRFYLAECYRMLSREYSFHGKPKEFAAYQKLAADQFEQLVMRGDSLNLGMGNAARRFLVTFYLDNKPRKAIEFLTSDVIATPSVWMRYQLVKAYQNTGQDSLAFATVQRLLSQSSETPLHSEILAQAVYLSDALNNSGARLELRQRYIQFYPYGINGAKYRWELAQVALMEGRYTEARQYIEHIINNAFYTSYASRANERLGELYYETGDYLAAAEEFKKQAEIDGYEKSLFIAPPSTSNVRAVLQTAYAYEKAGYTTNATLFYEWYVEIGVRDTAMAHAFEYLGDRAEMHGDWSQSISYYEQTLDILGETSFNAQIRLRRKIANIRFSRRQYEQAADLFLDAAQLSSDSTKHYLWTQGIVSLIRMDQVSAANRQISRFQESAQLGENTLPMLRFELEKCKYLARDKRFQESEERLRAILVYELPVEFRVEVRYELARQYVISNHYDKAIDILTDLTVNYSDHQEIGQTYITLGTVYYEQEQPANAINAFRNALNAGVSGKARQAAMTNLVKLYEESGLWDAAIAMAKNYINTFPEAADLFSTRIQIGTFLMNMREYDRAIDHLKKLLRIADSENASEIQFWLGECYFNQGDYKTAITEYLKVPYLHPPTKLDWAASALWKAGNAYERLKLNDKAIQLYQRIIREKGSASNFGRFARRRIDELESKESSSSG